MEFFEKSSVLFIGLSTWMSLQIDIFGIISAFVFESSQLNILTFVPSLLSPTKFIDKDKLPFVLHESVFGGCS